MDIKVITNIVSIYCLKDPKTDEIRYVGKTEGTLHRRLTDHISESKRGNTYKNNWIKSLLNQGLRPKIELIEWLAEQDWEQKEIYYIKFYREIGCEITNLSNGGLSTKGTPKRQMEKRYKMIQKFAKIKECQYEIFINMYASKVTTEEMAKYFNCHIGCISSTAKRLNVTRPNIKYKENKTRLYKNDDLPSLKYLFDQKISMAKIAKKLNCSESTAATIRDRMKDLNIID